MSTKTNAEALLMDQHWCPPAPYPTWMEGGPVVTDQRCVSVDSLGKYWFWDETWASCYGPFETLDACNKSLESYAKTL